MLSQGPIESLKAESSSSVDSITQSPFKISEDGCKYCFSDLRGVQWRINLGILPSSFSSIDELRRVTADARRRYAGLRRHLLVDPHFPKEGNNSPDLVIDNPLSQNPDSMWGRFFRNAELEKMVDQDLSRLYPELGSYFQTAACQGMLRRILLLWCLRHPEYGYSQGMHELLAPLLYVLQLDVQHLSQVRKLYEDHFTDKFDDLSFPESDLICNYKSLKWTAGIDDDTAFHGREAEVSSINELDPEIQTIVLLSDAYGTEGELGILLSERFLEHDAYCMFDGLMGGASGAVSMVDYFSPAPAIGSHTGVPPVIEASSALYHLLAMVDSSLHSHLIELGVEPQYFALRWLRVLFGREFSLDDLLIIWDEIFASENGKSILGTEDDVGSSFGLLHSPRGAFISAMAVSMLLHLRSSLLAADNATSCLQRLLNFPENIDVKKLVEKAKSLQALALDTSMSSSPALNGDITGSKPAAVRGHSLSSGSISPRTPLNLVPDSYWEEKWRVLHKAEEPQKGSLRKQVSTGIKELSEKVRCRLARAATDPPSAKVKSGNKDSRFPVRRRLLEDLARELGAEEDLENIGGGEVSGEKDDPSSVEVKVEERSPLPEDTTKENGIEENFSCVAEQTCLSRHIGSEESSSIFSASSSPISIANDCENDSDKSSVASNLFIDENDDDEDQSQNVSNDSPLPLSYPIVDVSHKPGFTTDMAGKQLAVSKERRLLSGKFQWFWKFGRSAGEGASEKGGNAVVSRSPSVDNNQNNVSTSSITGGCSTSHGDTADKNVMSSLRNLGQSMLENIQVIESVFQQDRGQLENLSRSSLAGKGQVTAMAALKELRKISNILSER